MKEKDPSHVSWKQMFLFTRNGSLQNADLLYAFFLGIAVLFLNFILGNRLTMLIEDLLPDSSRALKNFLGILVPTALCVLLAWLLFHYIRKKKIVLMAYLAALIITLVFAAAMLFTYDRETLAVMFPAIAGIFIIPALFSTLAEALFYRSWLRNNPDPIREEERELEQRQ